MTRLLPRLINRLIIIRTLILNPQVLSLRHARRQNSTTSNNRIRITRRTMSRTNTMNVTTANQINSTPLNNQQSLRHTLNNVSRQTLQAANRSVNNRTTNSLLLNPTNPLLRRTQLMIISNRMINLLSRNTRLNTIRRQRHLTQVRSRQSTTPNRLTNVPRRHLTHIQNSSTGTNTISQVRQRIHQASRHAQIRNNSLIIIRINHSMHLHNMRVHSLTRVIRTSTTTLRILTMKPRVLSSHNRQSQVITRRTRIMNSITNTTTRLTTRPQRRRHSIRSIRLIQRSIILRLILRSRSHIMNRQAKSRTKRQKALTNNQTTKATCYESIRNPQYLPVHKPKNQ